MLSFGATFRNAALTLALAATCALSSISLPATASAERVRTAPHDTMPAFRSEKQLKRYLKRAHPVLPPVPMPAPPPPPPPPAAAAPATEGSADKSVSTTESITNTQEAGVDEGGIVKNYRDLLVILRRGRLFTVSLKQGELKLIDVVDAYPPGTNPGGAWYDEMLVAGDRVIVIGYSYARGGTEVNRFNIDPNGHLDFEDAYHLRSNDYYSSRNYASRLIGTKLIVYSPLYLPYGPVDSFDWLPGVRRWTGDEKRAFTPIARARQIYFTENQRNPYGAIVEALHTVTTCDLAAPVMRCSAQGVLGPRGRSFYVSSNAVYVWVGNSHRYREEAGKNPSAMVYRLPLDGGPPSAIGARGMPSDQFSFREDGDDGILNVLVRSDGGGDAMWNPEFASGTVALLRLPLYAFGDGDEEARRAHYRKLPNPGSDHWAFQNRFVGDFVLYGAGNSWGRPQASGSTLVVAPVRSGDPTELPLKHGVDRIEAMGRDAVVVGTDASDLHFQAVELTAGAAPMLGDRYTLEHASQGETRSHGFFFKPDPRMGVREMGNGTLALPVARAARPGHRQLVEGSAAITFLRRTDRRFAPMGELLADEDSIGDDGCKASCVDWYGNARPIFLRDRTLALMGYEIVEGEVTSDRIRETRRINFGPPPR